MFQLSVHREQAKLPSNETLSNSSWQAFRRVILGLM